MALYFFSYDLNKQKNYQKLYDELNKFNAVRCLESLWCFNRFNTNSAGLRDYFSSFIDKDDEIFVMEVDPLRWASKSRKTPNDL